MNDNLQLVLSESLKSSCHLSLILFVVAVNMHNIKDLPFKFELCKYLDVVLNKLTGSIQSACTQSFTTSNSGIIFSCLVLDGIYGLTLFCMLVFLINLHLFNCITCLSEILMFASAFLIYVLLSVGLFVLVIIYGLLGIIVNVWVIILIDRILLQHDSGISHCQFLLFNVKEWRLGWSLNDTTLNLQWSILFFEGELLGKWLIRFWQELWSVKNILLWIFGWGWCRSCFDLIIWALVIVMLISRCQRTLILNQSRLILLLLHNWIKLLPCSLISLLTLLN